MEKTLEKLLIVEGVIFAILGVLFFVWPATSFIQFVYVCGILLIIAGIVTIVRGCKSTSKGVIIFSGIINLLFGIILLWLPLYSTEVILLFYGVWATIYGVYQLIVSIKYREIGFNLVTLRNILLIVLGLFVWFQPLVSLVALPYCLGAFFIIEGIYNIYIGFKL